MVDYKPRKRRPISSMPRETEDFTLKQEGK